MHHHIKQDDSAPSFALSYNSMYLVSVFHNFTQIAFGDFRYPPTVISLLSIHLIAHSHAFPIHHFPFTLSPILPSSARFFRHLVKLQAEEMNQNKRRV